MDACTIKLHKDTKAELDRYREYRNESYDEVVRKIVSILDTCRRKPTLSRNAVIDIEKARLRINQGKFISEKEAKLRLGL